MKIDISQVGSICQDFTNKKIKIFDKNNYCIWERSYSNENTFNRVFRDISKLFNIELKRRDSIK